MGLCLRRLVLQYPMLGWQPSTRISGNFQSESVATFARNTHLAVYRRTGQGLCQIYCRSIKLAQFMLFLSYSKAKVLTKACM